MKKKTKDQCAPKKGDFYKCETCGMEIVVTVDCKCGDDEEATFTCCGQPLTQE